MARGYGVTLFSILALAAVTAGAAETSQGDSQRSLVSTSASASPSATSAATAPDIFEAEARGLVSLRYIPNDAKSAQIVVTNLSKRPLTLRLPAAFAGVPVLAQMGMGMGGGGGRAGFGQGGIGGGGAQATGGGFGQQGMNGMGGMGGGGMGGMGGGGAFSIPPERARVFRAATVCLEHGKPEPTARLPYKVGPAASFSSDRRLEVVLEAVGSGRISQKVAQAAAWHLSSGLSWERLAAEAIDHPGGIPDEAYFSRGELQAAHALVGFATDEAARRDSATKPTPSLASTSAAE